MYFSRSFMVVGLAVAVALQITYSDCKESSSSYPSFFNARHAKGKTCGISSPQVFVHNVANPSLSLLYHRGKALFGVLMDKIEASIVDSESIDEQREGWEFISKTVTSSLNSAVDRLESEWEVFSLLSDTVPLPWEARFKSPLLYEILGRVEYGYLMVDAVVRAGIKEIVGSLQHQLVGVIRKLEKEVSHGSEEVSELKLLKQMKKGLRNMHATFTTRLLEKVVEKALTRYKTDASGSNKSSSSSTSDNFVSDALNQMAVVFHAFREKGDEYPNFWSEMSTIFMKELCVRDDDDVSEIVSTFIQQLISDQDKLIQTIISIISRGNK